MKVLQVSNTKSIWLFSTNDLNPSGIAHDGLLEAVRDRYQFQVVPTNAQVLDAVNKKQPVQLGAGTFKSSHGLVGVSLTYFADGLMAETRNSTGVGDELLTDLLDWLNSTYQMTNHREMKVRRIYSNELYLTFDNNLSFVNPKLRGIAAKYGAKAEWPNSTNRLEVIGISFGADPSSKSQLPPFRIERDSNAAFEDARYFSIAPLQTEDHMELLRHMEDVLVLS